MHIAIIGTGSAGLAAAYWLRKHHDVKIFEAESQAGGHAHTARVHPAGASAPIAVDTGFIVYNNLNYPNFIKMMTEIDVPDQHADMSFSVSFNGGAYEYKGEPWGLFAQRRNILNPAHWRMIRDLVRFYNEAPGYLNDARLSGLTITQLLAEKKFSFAFTHRHILPMAAAIWSTPTTRISGLPAEGFIRFFINHGLFDLDIHARPQWRSIAGGASGYVEKLLVPHGDNVFLNCEVSGITRINNKYRLSINHRKKNAKAREAGRTCEFDHVVLACHADQAAQLIRPHSTAIAETLLDIPYDENHAILHWDKSLMPRRKAAWAAWNYYTEAPPPHKEQRPTARPSSPVALTYWMNELQSLGTDTPIFVTLNPPRLPHPDKILGRYVYAHPQFSQKAVAAQRMLPDFQGRNGLWFCGAWCGYGFHEDGFAAGLAVAAGLGCPAPWHGTIDQRSPASENAAPRNKFKVTRDSLYETAQ